VWLAIIAIAVGLMAIMQVAIALVAWRLSQQVTATTNEIRRELRPLIAKVNDIADDAARATSLARLQVERVDSLLASTSERVDETLSLVQGAIVGPVRQGAALFTAIRAAFAAFRQGAPRSRQGRDEEEAWFVG
jgi:hypothetical protein